MWGLGPGTHAGAAGDSDDSDDDGGAEQISGGPYAFVIAELLRENPGAASARGLDGPAESHVGRTPLELARESAAPPAILELLERPAHCWKRCQTRAPSGELGVKNTVAAAAAAARATDAQHEDLLSSDMESETAAPAEPALVLAHAPAERAGTLSPILSPAHDVQPSKFGSPDVLSEAQRSLATEGFQGEETKCEMPEFPQVPTELLMPALAASQRKLSVPFDETPNEPGVI